MKQKKRRLLPLFSIIFVLCVIAGYCDYKYYVNNPEETTSEYEEEIDLGDVPGVCGKSRTGKYLASCKKVNCSSKQNSGACNASQCCQWAACSIKNCKTLTVNNSGQCVCSECDKYSRKTDGGKRCEPKPVSTCCVKTGPDKYTTLYNSTACSTAISNGHHVHSGSCNLCTNMDIAIPQKASQGSGEDSGITITGTNTLESGITCSWNVNAGGKKGELKCGGTYGCSVTIGGFKACTTVNVSVSGPTSKSGSVKIETDFTEETVNKNFKASEVDSIPKTPSNADMDGKSYYGNKNDCTSKTDGTMDCQVYVRSSCGTSYSYCCVDNGTLLTSSKATYKEYQPTKVCPTNWTLLENVKKEDCVIKNDVGSCDTSDISSPSQTSNTNVCEDTVSIKVDEGKKCTSTTDNEKTNFYEISCAKTVKTGFDYGNDGNKNTVRTLYKGEGFAFEINAETTVNCKYTFYDTVWTKAYNGVINRIKAIDSNLVQYVNKNDLGGWQTYINTKILNKNGVNNASELFRLWGIVEDLKNVVKAYNEYKPNDKYNESSKLTINTNEKGKSVVTTYDLMKTITDEGSYQKTSVSNKDLKVSGVTNPQSYNLSSKTPRKIVLIPKRVCIEKSTGKLIAVEGSKCPVNTLDGGNKIYINTTTDVTSKDAYPISIKVEGLGANGSLVINNKCDLKVNESKYIYRPIDVENPFINSEWKKGKNWVNEMFDFTKVIHANTWSDDSNRKTIYLTSKEIVSIKESNSRAWKDNSSPYLGLCDRQSVNIQDEITKKLCSLIK